MTKLEENLTDNSKHIQAYPKNILSSASDYHYKAKKKHVTAIQHATKQPISTKNQRRNQKPHGDK